jgi:predicted site-specific integrase-resolvase
LKLDKSRIELFVTPEQTSQQLGVNVDAIYQLADEGKLRAAVMTDGSIGISQQSVNKILPKEALPEYQLNAGLQGVPISINEAGRKYKLNTSTLTRWMQRGLIRQLGKDGRKTLLDEADVAYCARVYRQNSGQGKWAFDDSGRPYKK